MKMRSGYPLLPHIPLPQAPVRAEEVSLQYVPFSADRKHMHRFRIPDTAWTERHPDKLPFPRCIFPWKKPPVSPAAVFLRWPCGPWALFPAWNSAVFRPYPMQSAYTPVYSFIISHPAVIPIDSLQYFRLFVPCFFMAGLAI